MAIAGVILLLFTMFVRPHEVASQLTGVPLLAILFCFTLIGFILERRFRVRGMPQLPWIALFAAWAAISIAIRYPANEVPGVLFELAVPIGLFYFVAAGVRTVGELKAVSLAVVGCCAMIAIVGLHQPTADKGCVEVDWTEDGVNLRPDGRDCATPRDCNHKQNGRDYTCEHIGLMGTATVEGRIRYRGLFADPNELAVLLTAILPIALLYFPLRRRPVLALAAVTTVVVCVVLTRSRTGVVALAVSLGILFIHRYRARGLIVAGALGAVLLAIGGRSGTGASESVVGRYEAWAAAIDMFRAHPLGGVGFGRFLDYHYLTAHNTYLLVPAELGAVGLALWSAVLCTTIAVPWSALRAHEEFSRRAAVALLASIGALLSGMLFLSLSYHALTWTLLGLVAAYNNALRDTGWGNAPPRGTTLAAAAAGFLALVGVFALLLRWKGVW